MVVQPHGINGPSSGDLDQFSDGLDQCSGEPGPVLGRTGEQCSEDPTGSRYLEARLKSEALSVNELRNTLEELEAAVHR